MATPPVSRVPSESMDSQWDMYPVLVGDLDRLPPLSSKVVRVFLSSTFSDMSPERNALMEHVYPQLKTLCRQQYRLEFQMMDLRWGIREQSQDDHTIIEFCLREIENCQKQSLGPSFAILLGQKYGYRPFPPTINACEFETIRDELVSAPIGHDVSLLDTWFKKDVNVIPHVYRLQPISSMIPHYGNKDRADLHTAALAQWQVLHDLIQRLLRVGVQACIEEGLLSSDVADKYFMSVTEYEIEKGLYNSENVHKNCLCFNRYIDNLEENVQNVNAQKYLDTLEGGRRLDLDAQSLLYRMQNDRIPKVLTDERNTELFQVTWKDQESTYPSDDPVYLKNFCDVFREKMQWLINRSAIQVSSVSCSQEMIVEILQHLKTCRSRSEQFRGREDTLKRIHEYLLGSGEKPMVLHGESGSGKTSVVAKVVREIKNWFETSEEQPVIVLRFLGTTSHSCSIRLVLNSVCWQIASAYELDVSAIPVDYPGLVEYFHEILGVASISKGLVLLLDGLDQLGPDHHAHSLTWLPKFLPSNVHLILSTLSDRHGILDTLKAVVQDMNCFIQVRQLGAELSTSLIREWLRSSNRCVTTAQFEVVERALAGCSLPLYTSLVFEEVCRWCSYSELDQTILQPTVAKIINMLFDRVERYHGYIFVSHSLSYLTASRTGLSDVELEDLLSLDDVVLNDVFQHWLPPLRRVPPLLITRLRDELSSYLTMRETNGTVVFYWYHGQFISAARERYLSNDTHRSYIYAALAHYYLGTWGQGKKKAFKYSFKQLQCLSQETRKLKEADRKVPDQPLHFGVDTLRPGVLNYNLRKLSELPYYLVESRMFNDLKSKVLFNYDWLHAKLSAMSLHDVLSDFNLTAEAGQADVDVQLLTGALRVGGAHVARNPDTLAFDLIGRLLHYYDRPSSSHDGIRSLLQQCDTRSPHHSALLPVLPCFDSPSAMVLYVLEGHSQATCDIIFSRTTNELVSVSKDGIVAFWDLSTGERNRVIDISLLNPGRKTRLYQSIDGGSVIVDSDALDSPVHIYDMKTCQLKHSFGVRLPTQQRGFLAGNLLCRQKSIVDVRTGFEIRIIDDFVCTKSYVPCALSPDGLLILVGVDNAVQLFDFETSAPLATFRSCNPPSVLAVSEDGRRGYVGYATDCRFCLLDIDRDSPSFSEITVEFDCCSILAAAESSAGGLSDQRFPKEIAEITCSPTDVDVVLLNVRRYRLVLFNTHKCRATVMKDVTYENAQTIYSSAFSFDAHYVLASVDNFLKVWQAHSGTFMQAIQLHSTPSYAFAVSQQRNLVATGSTINTAIRVLDLDKAQTVDAPELKVYENPVDCVACARNTRLAFIKSYYGLSSSTEGYKYMNYFGVDIWNVSTGTWHQFLPFNRYGKLLQMNVSPDGTRIALLLNAMHNFTTVVLNATPPSGESGNVYFRSRQSVLCQAVHSNCTSFQVSPDWRHLVTCSYSMRDIHYDVILWDVDDPDNPEKPFRECSAGHKVVSFDGASAPVFTLDSRLLLYVDLSRTVIAYDLQTLAPRYRLTCISDLLLALPRHRRLVLITTFNRSTRYASPKVTIWELSRTPRQTVQLADSVGTYGILSVSADSRLAVDGRLQVFDLKTGKIVQRFMKRNESDIGYTSKEYSMVLLTDDGLFVIWADELSIKVGRVRDGLLIANTTTHERPTSLETMDHGYVLLVGCEDGHVMTMKLVISDVSVTRSTYRPRSVGDRRNFLLDADVCTREAINAMDELFQHPAQCIPDSDLPTVSENVIDTLVRDAVVPHTVILTSNASPSSTDDDGDRRRGSSPSLWKNGSPAAAIGSSPLLDRDYRSNTPSPVHFADEDRYSSVNTIGHNAGQDRNHNRRSAGNKPYAKRSRSAQDLYQLSATTSSKEEGASNCSTLPKLDHRLVPTELTKLLQSRIGNKDRNSAKAKSPLTARNSGGWFKSSRTDRSPAKAAAAQVAAEKKGAAATAKALAKSVAMATPPKERRRPLRAFLQLAVPNTATRTKHFWNDSTLTGSNAVGTPVIGEPTTRERTPSI